MYFWGIYLTVFPALCSMLRSVHLAALSSAPVLNLPPSSSRNHPDTTSMRSSMCVCQYIFLPAICHTLYYFSFVCFFCFHSSLFCLLVVILLSLNFLLDFCVFHLFICYSFTLCLLSFMCHRLLVLLSIKILRISRSVFIFLVYLHLDLLHLSAACPTCTGGSWNGPSKPFTLPGSACPSSFLPSFISVSIPSFGAPWGRQ